MRPAWPDNGRRVAGPPEAPGFESVKRTTVATAKTAKHPAMAFLVKSLHLLCRTLQKHPAAAEAAPVTRATGGVIRMQMRQPIASASTLERKRNERGEVDTPGPGARRSLDDATRV
mmetsp:Transcript_5879/g.17416  ORF Transcript_5879/g.17416 Transcript_5879/m.17416 type:complete len:116 (+) Transcript_5879:505-852(+)